MSGARVEHLVVLSLEPWDEIWRRNQYLVRELMHSRDQLRVLFVGPATRSLTRPQVQHAVPGAGSVGRLCTFAPALPMPRRALGRAAAAALLRQVRRAARHAGLGRPTLWVNDASYANALLASDLPLLYDITDDWTLPTMSERERCIRRADDVALLDRADEVVVCSEALRSSRGVRRDVSLISNAVDLERYRESTARPADLPAGSTAVYVGTLHDDRIDVELCERLASRAPDIQLVLVGPDHLSEPSRSRLRDHRNVHLLGPRPFHAVPGYLQHASVLVVPHRRTPFTDSLDPIKAHEYQAVQRPTVSTPVPGFRDAPWVQIGDGDAFVDAVVSSLDRRPPVAADPPTWRDRAREFGEVLDRAAHRAHHRRRSIVYLDHCARLSGGELALTRLLAALPEVDATVVLAEEGPLEDELRSVGADVRVEPMAESVRGLERHAVRPGLEVLRQATVTARYSWRLSRALRRDRPTLVHTNSLKAALYGAPAARLAGVPVVWHVRDRIAEDYMPSAAVRLVQQLSRVLPTAVIANSRATLATVGVRQGRGVVIPSPVVYDSVAPASSSRSRASGPVTFAMVGRIAPWKGQDVFIDAFAQAFADGDERALIIGAPLFHESEHQFDDRIRRQATDVGLGGRIEFLGHRSDVGELLERTDVLVHASVVPEPFGQVVVEGLAAGCAVIAANAGGPTEVITDGVDGLLVEPGDRQELSRAMRRLTDDPALRRRLATAGAETSAHFEPEQIAEKVRDAYADLLAAHEGWGWR